MDLKVNTNNQVNIDKNILDLFWSLCDKDTNTRLNACADILHLVLKKQQKVENENEANKDLKYCIERLIKGLASPRDAARLGYSLLLTEILKRIDAVQVEEILELLKQHMSVTNKQDKRDVIFGQLFAYTSLVRSRRLPNHPLLSQVILSIYELTHGKHYILNASYEILLDLFSQLTGNFKDVWALLKKKLPSDWETCSADSLWFLLLCIRLFPDTISTKYMKNHWGSHDIFASDNLSHFKKIIKQTTSCLPNLHPLCSEFLLLAKQRKDFCEIWNIVVDENLFDHEQNQKSFVGFELIKLALRDEPTKKVLKVVLSPKFRSIFSKSYINSKHPMNSAASHLADFLYNFVKKNNCPDMQIIVLKTFLQPHGTVLLEPILKKKEVSMIIQNLLPEAVKSLCEILKSVLLKKKLNDNNEKEVNNLTRFQASRQIANLVAHPVMLTDIEWRLEIIQFFFLHAFFVIKESTSEIPHCENICEPLSDALRDSCMTAFFKSVNSLHIRSETQRPSLNSFLEQLLSVTVYADKLMSAPENIEPKFSVEKIKDPWNSLKTIVHKLRKQSKKDGLVNESNAFQALFLPLGLHLFQHPDDIPELLEELHICCKKSLKLRKHDSDSMKDKESEPPWIGVVIDILLSLLSKSSKHLHTLVLQVFPLFCPFIDSNALQQILDVINPRQSSEDMLVDESDNEDGQNIDFGSGSSSDESDEEADHQPVDEEFKKKVQCALGPAADNSDAESVVLSDSEMFRLDNALSEAFKIRLKSGNSQLSSEEKALLHFRVRCLDLILAYLRSQPPMHLVLKCVEPVLAAFEFGHHSKHQNSLLIKSISVLQFMTKIRKFQHHKDISKSELKRLLDILIPKCHKEINMSVSQKLSSLCVFIVLCYRKLEGVDSPNKKKSSKHAYVKTYLSALETFVSSGSSHMLPNFFTNLMEACPDLAWHFIEPCKNYGFNSTARLFKKTQCLGLLSESLKYSKSQKELPDDRWLELANSILPVVIESLKNVFETTDFKPIYTTEHLNIIHTLYLIIMEKTGQSILENPDLLELLTNTSNGKMKKLNVKGRKMKNWIIIRLGGEIKKSEKSQVANEDENAEDQMNKMKRKLEEVNEDEMDYVNGDVDLSNKKKKKLKNKKKSKSGLNAIVDNTIVDNGPSDNNN